MAPNSTIVVLLNIGHKASHMTFPDGSFTHEWSAYVTGVDGIDIQHFVERVVFKLHETFENPVQVLTQPPYMISEKGYASFGLKLEIVFKNNDTPNHIEYDYDLVLPGDGQPPVKYFRQEKLIFRNTPDDFRQKLLKGGAMETDPEAKEELAREKREAEKAAKMAASDATHTSEEEKPKNKKDAKSTKRKNKSDKEKKSGLTKSSADSLSQIKKASGLPKSTISQSDSSASSTSSNSPVPSPTMGQPQLKPTGQLTADSTSSSDDEDAVASTNNSNNHSQAKGPPASLSHNGLAVKKPKLDKDLRPTKKSERVTNSVKKAPNGIALEKLMDLYEKMKDTDDPNLLQTYVDVIEETGKFKLTGASFDFDLCVLDAAIIHKLESLLK